MQKTKTRSLGLAVASVAMAAAAIPAVAMTGEEVEQAFAQATASGYIRSHYNSRLYSTRPDASAFALGGGLRAETGAVSGVKLGVGFYTAHDLGLNDEDPAKVDGRMGSELDVLGEAYINVTRWNTGVTVGRQKLFTPLANPIDVFIVPFTFEGVSIKNNTLPNLTLELDYINTIKSAGSDRFEDVGIWNTRRLGVEQQETAGTLMMGGVYRKDALDAQAWYYNFDDMFNTVYLHGGYTFSGSEMIKPFVAAQFITQSEVGDELLGRVDSNVVGFQAGSSFGQAKAVLGYTATREQANAFNRGAFLAPYNFSTSPLFTNSMVENIENVDSGNALKMTLFYTFPKVELKLSYAHYDFTEIAERGATDFDVIYNLSDRVKGLTLRYRVEVVTSDSEAVEQQDHRFQLQYLF